MSVPAAYLGIILIWSTTPLAIKWSSAGGGFLFGVSARMALGAVVCLGLLVLLRLPLPWHRAARRAYGIANLGIFGAMLCTYWGAQYIPSGLISVLYGMTPLITGVLAALWLGERSLSPLRLFGVLLGIAGLGLIFLAGHVLEQIAWEGIAAVLLGVLMHGVSAVWLKREQTELHPLSLNSGALLLAVPLYLLTWLLFDHARLPQLDTRTTAAIIYLGLLGTALGFVLYFYVLKQVSAAAVSLITLITPVLALLLGRWLNAESVGLRIWLGTVCILAGLMVYQWGGAIVQRLRRAFARQAMKPYG